jgi:hypothetical protein
MKKPITLRIKKELIFDESDINHIAKCLAETFWDALPEEFDDINRDDIDEEDLACLTRAIADEFLNAVEED